MLIPSLGWFGLCPEQSLIQIRKWANRTDLAVVLRESGGRPGDPLQLRAPFQNDKMWNNTSKPAGRTCDIPEPPVWNYSELYYISYYHYIFGYTLSTSWVRFNRTVMIQVTNVHMLETASARWEKSAIFTGGSRGDCSFYNSAAETELCSPASRSGLYRSEYIVYHR